MAEFAKYIACVLAILLVVIPSAFAQDGTGVLEGTVVNASGETLPGVNIFLEGTDEGAPTNPQGQYRITEIEAGTYRVTASFVGFGDEVQEGVEIRPGETTTLDFTMQQEATGLDEIVVVGYGTQQRKDLTGSVSTISGEDLEDIPLESPDQALEGRVAGVQVRSNSHEPGGSVSVNVRGTSSLSASSQPLYVIDGFPISYNPVLGVQESKQAAPPLNPLATIDASNIESIEVLKDASATAIYGSRGSNGVVLITTKSGQRGEARVNFKSSVSLQQPSKKLDFLGAQEWARLRNKQAELQGVNLPFTSEDIASMSEGTDWQDEIFRSAAPSQNYELSFSGGNETVNYFVSGNYYDQEGIIRGSDFERYSARLNLDSDITENLSTGVRITASYADRSRVPTGTKGYGNYPSIVESMFSAAPTVPAYNEDGDPSDPSNYTLGGGENPLEIAERYNIDQNDRRFLGSLYGEYQLTDELSVRSRVGADLYNTRSGEYYPIGSQTSDGRGGVGILGNTQRANLLNENTLRYETLFGEKHQFNALAGFTYQHEEFSTSSDEAWGFPSDYYSYNNLGLASNPQAPTSAASSWSLLSYLGRANYVFDDRYLLTGTVRADGSSRFGENNKFGVFPSGAVAWRVSEEPFMEDQDLFSNLKLRVSYGITGNDAIGEYNSLALVSTGRSIDEGTAYGFGEQLQPIAYPANFANPNLSWEKSREIDIGIDIGLFEQRLNFTADYYNRNTTDLLLTMPLPTQSGFSSQLQNVGEVSNNGIELALQSYNFVGNFSWMTNFNIAFNRSEVVDLGDAPYLYAGWVGGGNVDSHGSRVARLEPGHPIGAFYGSRHLGIWESQEQIDRIGTMPDAEPGDLRFADLNGDGVWDPTDDDTFLGNPNPDFTFGLANNWSYNRWGLDVFLQGSYGNDVLNLNKESWLGGSWEGLRNSWTPEDSDNTGLGLASGFPDIVSNYNVEDGSYLRIKNVRLSYTISEGLVTGLSRAKIFLAGQNLYTFTDYSGYDPEVNAYGYSNVARAIDMAAYPAVRSFRVGINLSF